MRVSSAMVLVAMGCGGSKPLPVVKVPAAANPAASCEPYELRFAPGEHLKYVHTRSIERLKTEGANAGVRETIVVRSDVELRQTGETYVVHTTPAPAQLWRADGATISPLAYVALELPLVYELDAAGMVQEVRGNETITARLQAAARDPDELRAAAAITPEVLQETRKAEWDGLFGDWSGAEGCIGDVVASDSEMPLPTGPITFQTVTEVSGYQACPLGRCVTIESHFDTDTQALASFLETRVFKPRVNLLKTEVFGSIIIVTEPSTLRTVSLESERTIRLVLDEGKGANATTLLERQRHTFAY
jgi:hypothetical protein